MLHAADVEARLSRPTAAKPDKVVVAVRAEKVVSKSALAWALTHVVQPGDGIVLLAVFSSKRTGNCCGIQASIELNRDCRLRAASFAPLAFSNCLWSLTVVALTRFCLWIVEGRKLWKFSRLSGDYGCGERQEIVDRISESCSQMVLQFHDQVQVHFDLVSWLFLTSSQFLLRLVRCKLLASKRRLRQSTQFSISIPSLGAQKLTF